MWPYGAAMGPPSGPMAPLWNPMRRHGALWDRYVADIGQHEIVTYPYGDAMVLYGAAMGTGCPMGQLRGQVYEAVAQRYDDAIASGCMVSHGVTRHGMVWHDSAKLQALGLAA